jgi:hypothetical protein
MLSVASRIGDMAMQEFGAKTETPTEAGVSVFVDFAEQARAWNSRPDQPVAATYGEIA